MKFFEEDLKILREMKDALSEGFKEFGKFFSEHKIFFTTLPSIYNFLICLFFFRSSRIWEEINPMWHSEGNREYLYHYRWLSYQIYQIQNWMGVEIFVGGIIILALLPLVLKIFLSHRFPWAPPLAAIVVSILLTILLFGTMRLLLLPLLFLPN